MNVIYLRYKGRETGFPPPETTFELVHCLLPSFRLFKERKREDEEIRAEEVGINFSGYTGVVVKARYAASVNQRNIISLIQTPGCNGVVVGCLCALYEAPLPTRQPLSVDFPTTRAS